MKTTVRHCFVLLGIVKVLSGIVKYRQELPQQKKEKT
jgi:hypothetical protein